MTFRHFVALWVGFWTPIFAFRLVLVFFGMTTIPEEAPAQVMLSMLAFLVGCVGAGCFWVLYDERQDK